MQGIMCSCIQYVKIGNYDAALINETGVDISDGTAFLRLPAMGIMDDGAFAIRIFRSFMYSEKFYIICY